MSQPSYRAQWARRLVRKKVEDELSNRSITLKAMEDEGLGDAFQLLGPGSSVQRTSSSPDGLHKPLKVCIVGAGLAGLYTALILDSLEDPSISYDILEASAQAGGRVRTHRFSTALHDYCDTGAMRFPNIPLMKRAFDLFRLVDVPLAPYHMNGTNCPTLFNDILKIGREAEEQDAFNFGKAKGGLVPDIYAVKGADRVMEEVFKPFKDALSRDFDGNFELLLKQDRLSTKEFLRDTHKFDYHTIQWLETMCSATGLFDQSFTESVLDSLDLDYPTRPVQWQCIDGGCSLLVDRLLKLIKRKPCVAKPVLSIGIDRLEENETNIFVKVRSEPAPRKYDTVFNTTSLACMQRMDLSRAELHPAQKEAIRSLHYDASAKVAFKFRYPWWVTKCNITKAGVATTDTPLRMCVYPSYGLSDEPDEAAVLLCSYTWSQDALRIGALISDSSPSGEEELRDLVLRGLACLHAHSISYEEIAEAYITHYAFDWSNESNVSGAFALFGPGQFSHLYPYLTQPTADSKLHVVGEAASAHHAWLVGALDSAYRAVHHFLQRFDRYEGLRRLQHQWGTPDEMEAGESGTARVQVMLGRLRPEEHLPMSSYDELEELDELDGFVLIPRGCETV